MQTLKIIKISEGVFKHILVEESGIEHAFYNTKETKLSIDLGTFSISSAGQNRSFTVQNIQVFAIDAVNPTNTETLDDLVNVLATLKYPPLLESQSSTILGNNWKKEQLSGFIYTINIDNNELSYYELYFVKDDRSKDFSDPNFEVTNNSITINSGFPLDGVVCFYRKIEL